MSAHPYNTRSYLVYPSKIIHVGGSEMFYEHLLFILFMHLIKVDESSVNN